MALTATWPRLMRRHRCQLQRVLRLRLALNGWRSCTNCSCRCRCLGWLWLLLLLPLPLLLLLLHPRVHREYTHTELLVEVHM